MKRRLRRYRRQLRKKLIILSRRFINRFTIRSQPRITHGNKVALVKSGHDAFKTLLSLIESSRDEINLEYYIFREDRHGTIIADSLKEKARNGVRVNLLYDWIGSIDTDKKFFDDMMQSGVNVVAFNPIKLFSNPFKWDRRDHRKLAIFDGKTAIVSGWNIGSEYFRENEESMRDAGLVVEGPCVRVLLEIYYNVLSRQCKGRRIERKFKRIVPAGHDEVWVIESGPKFKTVRMYNAYLLAIMAAKKSVYIENAYFVPPLKLRNALVNAARRGVDVKTILPDQIDVPLVKYASYNHFKVLLSAGVRIFERTRLILHSKIACVDDVWVTIGSTNLHRRSFLTNFELNIVVIGEKLGKQVTEFMNEDLRMSNPISLSEWTERPLSLRLKEKVAALFSIFL